MNFQAFLNTLPIMGMGMLGIFVVMFVIYMLIGVLNKSGAAYERFVKAKDVFVARKNKKEN